MGGADVDGGLKNQLQLEGRAIVYKVGLIRLPHGARVSARAQDSASAVHGAEMGVHSGALLFWIHSWLCVAQVARLRAAAFTDTLASSPMIESACMQTATAGTGLPQRSWAS